LIFLAAQASTPAASFNEAAINEPMAALALCVGKQAKAWASTGERAQDIVDAAMETCETERYEMQQASLRSVVSVRDASTAKEIADMLYGKAVSLSRVVGLKAVMNVKASRAAATAEAHQSAPE
jgi:hypothetical protein